jgi:bifunctional DNA-binding transcriptional regulator/antitoxin component of YhaV-PrlF toxin-antitoxin module
MQQIVTITNQGQITIPASMRRAISLDLYKKALVKIENQRIIVEPIVDLLSLGGIISNKAKKQKKIEDIIKIEEDVISKMIK